MRDLLSSNMTEKEIEELDIYLEEVVLELKPFFSAIDNILSNPEKRKKVSQLFKQGIKEQGWQEKLSKIT